MRVEETEAFSIALIFFLLFTLVTLSGWILNYNDELYEDDVHDYDDDDGCCDGGGD